MRDWPVAETSTGQHTALRQTDRQTDIPPTGTIQTCNPSKRVAADPHLKTADFIWYIY